MQTQANAPPEKKHQKYLDGTRGVQWKKQEKGTAKTLNLKQEAVNLVKKGYTIQKMAQKTGCHLEMEKEILKKLALSLPRN